MADYALRLDEAEIARYRQQVRRADERDADGWSAAGVVPGATVVDLGCGPGALLGRFATTVGPSGRVIGVDADPAAVEQARREADDPVVEVIEADVTASGVAPGSADVVVLRHVLAHNGGREQEIVDHAASLLRPGGTLSLFDVDMTLVRVQPPIDPLPELYERYHAFQRARGNDDAVGLRLGELLETAGLAVLDFRGSCTIKPREVGARGPAWAARQAMLDDGTASHEDLDRWEEAFVALDARATQPTWFLFGFTALGRRA